jgi:hypothetical protein
MGRVCSGGSARTMETLDVTGPLLPEAVVLHDAMGSCHRRWVASICFFLPRPAWLISARRWWWARSRKLTTGEPLYPPFPQSPGHANPHEAEWLGPQSSSSVVAAWRLARFSPTPTLCYQPGSSTRAMTISLQGRCKRILPHAVARTIAR